MSEIDWTKEVEARHKDGSAWYPVIWHKDRWIWVYHDKQELPFSWHIRNCALRNKPEPPKVETRTVWFNVYSDTVCMYYTHQRASEYRSCRCLATKKIDFTFTHGEGLDDPEN